ncbi:hypothetical protein FAI40_07355 [Acetobacteraceae bacterium]|nr:hypothetical protein FAI40_07355 [Acetobacteraceae bacterium]
MGNFLRQRVFSRYLALFSVTLPLASCMGLGHRMMHPDVTGYSNAITETQKMQLLHAMLERRYGNLPTFVNVTQIISGHSAQQTAQLSLAGTAAHIKLENKGFRKGAGPEYSDNGPAITGKLGYEFTDKSTLSYQPILGQKYISNLVHPMPVSTVMPLFLGGIPIDILLRLSMRWVGDISNVRAGKFAGSVRFYLLLEDLRKLQEVGAISVTLEENGKEEAKVFLLFNATSEGDIEQVQREVKRLLHLSPDVKKVEIIQAAHPETEGQVAVLTNSALSMLGQVAAGIEVPKKDIEQGLVPRTVDERSVTRRPLIIVHCSTTAPYDAYVALPFRGSVYWIDDKDFESKQAFNLLKVLCNLATVEGADSKNQDKKSAESRIPTTTISKKTGKISVKAPAGD